MSEVEALDSARWEIEGAADISRISYLPHRSGSKACSPATKSHFSSPLVWLLVAAHTPRQGHRLPQEAMWGARATSNSHIERGATDPRSSTLNAIQMSFEKAGVVFLEPGDTRDNGPGLRLKKPGRRR
jgi:hypothetical protein